MKNADSQIILYAKGWFERKDVWQDLKILVGDRCGLRPEHVNDRDVIDVVLGIAMPEFERNTEYFIRKFISGIAGNKWTVRSDNAMTPREVHTNVLESLLTIIQLMQVNEIVDGSEVVIVRIDPPNYDLLPKGKDI